jgi:hypothetical protein
MAERSYSSFCESRIKANDPVPLLAEITIPDPAAIFPPGKQIYRQSWKR